MSRAGCSPRSPTHRVEVLDIDQAVIRGQLTLGVLVGTPENPDGAAGATSSTRWPPLGMTVRVADRPARRRPAPAAHARRRRARPAAAGAAPSACCRCASAELGVNIEAIKRIADYPVTGLELIGPGARTTRRCGPPWSRSAPRPGSTSPSSGSGIARRAKRLIVFDVDSTLITGEVIEMLADHTGTRARVEQITAAAMRGELDFADSLRARVAMLEGLDAAVLDEVGRRPRAHPRCPHHGPHAQAARLPVRHRVRRFHPGHPAPGRRPRAGLRRRQHPRGRRRPAHRPGGRRDRRPGRARRGRWSGSPPSPASR